MDIELVKSNLKDPMEPVVPVQGVTLSWEKPLAREFDVHVAVGQTCNVPPGVYAHLLIAITGRGLAEAGIDGRIAQRALNSGEFIFLPARTSIKLTPLGKDDCTYVLLELR